MIPVRRSRSELARREAEIRLHPVHVGIGCEHIDALCGALLRIYKISANSY